jgi:hypothetical protein
MWSKASVKPSKEYCGCHNNTKCNTRHTWRNAQYEHEAADYFDSRH